MRFKYYQRGEFSWVMLALLVTLLFQPHGVKADSQTTVVLPDTLASRQFSAWLHVYNSGNRVAIRQFASAHHQDKPGASSVDELTDVYMKLYKDDGQYDVRKLISSSADSIAVAVESRATGCWVALQMKVAAEPPYNLAGFSYSHVEMPEDLLPHKELSESEIRTRVDGLITKLIKADNFSGVVLVAKNGEPFYQREYGLANRAWNESNQTNTKLNLASICKMFTAVAIAQLVEQDKLSYKDTVGKILPDYPNKEVAQKVTIQELLSHTSGLASKSLDEFRKGFRTLKEYLPSFDNAAPEFEPGTKYSYSNDGFLLLGVIVEKMSGESYYDYVREHVFKPAGMTATDYYELDSDPPNLAEGLMEGPNGTRRNNIFALPVKGLPFGLGYSTAEDLLKFNSALVNRTLLSANSLETLWTGKTDKLYNGPDGQYGYGFFVKRYNGTRIIGHGGGWPGVTNQVDMYPDLGYTVVILTNYDDSPRIIAYKLREWLAQGRP